VLIGHKVDVLNHHAARVCLHLRRRWGEQLHATQARPCEC
jgi:hypothetical protein